MGQLREGEQMLLATRGDEPALPADRIGLRVEERIVGGEPPIAPVAHLSVDHGWVVPTRPAD
jgi:hypothetical protein